MNRTALVIAFAGALSLAQGVAAQQPQSPPQSLVRLIGVVRAAPGGGFGLDAGDVVLSAETIDLQQFVGQITELTGTLRPAVIPPLLDVASAERAPSRFQTSGDTRVGRALQLRVDVPRPGRWYLYFAPQPGMMTLEWLLPFGSGTLWLDPATIVTIAAGPLQQTWTDRLVVPNSPDLVGATIWFQAAVHLEPGPLLFLNQSVVRLLP